ncbi:hypothetical protein GCK72_020986 [Caenorhabditis remanei]|uniref:Uncharacterized protein n=1 Tax=Caenorhabditis remanei TaxID=31234 RepID=A0A6A5GIN2_CAERE|nr:hypothetical protein GCK72_020986 [Caenorhabditis remanei]KAF1754425.1 hypothetical protein GCK72_020986 [Caenorhabditis remanei]
MRRNGNRSSTRKKKELEDEESNRLVQQLLSGQRRNRATSNVSISVLKSKSNCDKRGLESIGDDTELMRRNHSKLNRSTFEAQGTTVKPLSDEFVVRSPPSDTVNETGHDETRRSNFGVKHGQKLSNLSVGCDSDNVFNRNVKRSNMYSDNTGPANNTNICESSEPRFSYIDMKTAQENVLSNGFPATTISSQNAAGWNPNSTELGYESYNTGISNTRISNVELKHDILDYRDPHSSSMNHAYNSSVGSSSMGVSPTGYGNQVFQTGQFYPNSMHPTPPPVPVVMDLSERLRDCVSKGILDLFRAGILVYECYVRRMPEISQQCDRFAKKLGFEVTGFSMPSTDCFSNPNYSSIVMHGQMIYSLLMANKAAQLSPISREGESQFRSLVGAIYRTRGLGFRYPEMRPFSGEELFIIDRPDDRNTKTGETHIILKRLIFQLLGRACEFPTDIQKSNWTLPYEASYITQENFPEDLYLNMRTFFLHYLGINESELDNNVWCDDFSTLKCLASWDSIAAKKKTYRTLSLARAAYLSKDGFHSCLREALREIKRATYSPPTQGERFGTWSYRDRNLKRQAQVQTH